MDKSNLARNSRFAALLTALIALLLAACASNTPTKTVTVTAGSGNNNQPSSSGAQTTSASSAPSTKSGPPAKPVHIKLLNYDGAQYGVGMPVIAFFSKKISNGKPLQDITTVTVNGQKAKGAWYFEYSSYYKGYPIEGHFRLENYWPAHAKIHVGIPAKGVSAGKGLAFNDSLTLDFTTGARNIGVISDVTHTITITSDGKLWHTFPVSLGEASTPTAHGIKVIMEKGASICMKGPGYDECGIQYTQRLTYGGEYLHSAPWNIYNIDHGIDSSNGCTNMLPADAKLAYSFLEVGDVMQYPNANGPAMQLGTGYGDWNVNWGAWQTGGLVSTI